MAQKSSTGEHRNNRRPARTFQPWRAAADRSRWGSRQTRCRSAPLTRGFPPTAPTYLAAAIPPARPCTFLALHLNDIVQSGSRIGDFRLNGDKSARRTNRSDYERASGKAGDQQKLAHAGFLQCRWHIKARAGVKFRSGSSGSIDARGAIGICGPTERPPPRNVLFPKANAGKPRGALHALSVLDGSSVRDVGRAHVCAGQAR